MHARVLQAMAQFVLVPYHGGSPNTRNGARLRSPSPILAPYPMYKHKPSILVTFLGGGGGEVSDHFSGKNGALRWSILVGK